jgi:hypothetical protein
MGYFQPVPTGLMMRHPSICEPILPIPIHLCDNLEGFVTLSCRNLEVSLSSLLLF